VGASEVKDSKTLWLESFDQAWSTIERQHFDPKLGGVDWAAARRELRPQMEAATTEQEARAVIENLLKRLGHSHVALIPREAYPESPKAQGDAEPGFEVRRWDGEFVVTRVAPGSPAAMAGVRPGWTLESIDGVVLLKSAKASNMHATWWAQRLLRGQAGQEVRLDFREKPSLRVPRANPPGKLARFGNLPPFPLEIEFSKLPGKIGYLRLTAFFDPEWLEAELRRGIKECEECAGFVLDLRGNPGGLGILSASVAGWFLDHSTSLGRLEYRAMTLRLEVEPRPANYLGKLAILTDEMSYSTSELLAGGLKDIGRARVFGRRTGGGALPSMIERLPSGDALQYVFANYISVGGRPLEGVGITPDEEIRPTKAQLLAGRDPILEAATTWIGKGEHQ
jgi:carboxyl-terminal processing protease